MDGLTILLHYIGLEVKETTNKFVSNKLKEIQKIYIQWRYISTEENASGVASRGCSPQGKPTGWWFIVVKDPLILSFDGLLQFVESKVIIPSLF